MKKVVALLLVALAAGGVVFADISFENKLYSDGSGWLVRYNKHSAEYLGSDYYDSKETITDFPVIRERMKVEFTSDQVDAMLKIRFKFDDQDGMHYKFYCDQSDISDLDYYIAFRPIKEVTLSMHQNIYTAGSYLPIYDDNVSAGNLGSSGFTVAYRPEQVPGLTIAGSLPMENWLDGDSECEKGKNKDKNEDDELNFQAGLDYNYKDLLTLGATVRDIIDGDDDDGDEGRSFGVYATLNTIKHFTIGGGLALYEATGIIWGLDWTGPGVINIEGDNLSNIEVSLDLGKFFIMAEALWTFDQKCNDKANPYDFYSSAMISFALKQFTATATGMLFLDLGSHDDELDPATCGEFLLTYTMGRHDFSVGVDLERAKDIGIEMYVGFPLIWKYSF